MGESRSLKGVEVPEVEATAPIHECFGELGHPDEWVNNKGKPPWLEDAILIIHPVKIDWGFGPAQVLWDRPTHGVDHPTSELEHVT
jgi:hypothetical protein